MNNTSLGSILMSRNQKLLSGTDWHDDSLSLVPTGFSALDKALGGGLPDGQLTVLGAEPSNGKTTLALQILEQMCKGTGRPGLVVSLEMTAADLANKALVRDIYRHNINNLDACFCVNDLDNPEFIFTESQKNAHYESVGRIADTLDNISVVDVFSEQKSIVGALEEAVKDVIKTHQKAPLVVVDYLQLIRYNAGADDKRTDIDNVIAEFKRICRKYSVLMILISAVSRKAYGRRLTTDAFKESGGVEFSADVLLGLEYVNLDEAKINLINRYMELIILKNRKSVRNVTVRYNYNAKYDFFDECKCACCDKTYDNTPEF